MRGITGTFRTTAALGRRHMAGGRRRGRALPTRRLVGWGLVVGTLTACGESQTGTGPTGPGSGLPQVAAVVVSPDSSVLGVGEAMQLTAVALSASGDTVKGVPMTWSSNDTLVARVTPAGLVTGLEDGNTRIRATAGARSGFAAVTIGALNPVPTIAALSPAFASAGGPGLVLTITGTGFRPNVRVQWNGTARPTALITESEIRATIWAGDLATVGAARIQVINSVPGGGASPEVMFPILVQTVPVESVELSHAVALTIRGAAVPVRAVLRDAAGTVLTDRLVTWTSSNQLVATVVGDGVVQPVGEGEALITATSEGKSATLALTVGTKITHLILDDGATGLSVLDMRLGVGPTRFWEHTASMPPSDPSVSPDGRRIAYTIQLGDKREIAVLDQATRTYQFLTTDGASDQPAWSPTGDRIAFRSSRAGRSDIWVMSPDGTGAVNLTAALPAGWQTGYPAWSPDGTRLVFSAGFSEDRMTLHLIRADGTGFQPLLFSTYLDVESSWQGSAVVFTRRSPDGRSDLYRIPVNGGPLIQLTHTGDASMPAWSPDGRWIAFASGPIVAGRQSIMAVRPFGEETRPLSRINGPDGGGRNPTWLTHN